MRRLLIIVLFANMFCLVGASASAGSTLPIPGLAEQAAAQADRYDPNTDVSPHLVALAKQRLLTLTGDDAAARLVPVPNADGLPSQGKVNILVLPVQFKGQDAELTRSQLEARMFLCPVGSNAPYESLNSYYSRSSRRKLDITGTVLPWYKTTYTRSSLGGDRVKQEATIREAIEYWNAKGKDFSQYDNNNDGTIDYMIVIWTGDSGSLGGPWWPHFTQMGTSSLVVDGKSLHSYTSQTTRGGGWGTPRVTIHETGHALGLPDLYDPESMNAVGPKGGVGGLDMMDKNFGDLNGYYKFLLGWNQPNVVRWGDDQTIKLRAAETSPDAILACVDAEYGSPYSEFFFIEKRLKRGNDLKAPGEGVLIWHIDGALDDSGERFASNNQSTSHKLVRLMEADGKEHIERGYSWWNLEWWKNDAIKVTQADYYGAGKAMGPATTPNTQRYDGDPSGLRISVGSTTNGATTVRVRQAVPTGDTRIALTWGAFPEDIDAHLTGPLADGSRFHVFWDVLGDAGYATLDHDDTTSYGPETVTISNQTEGVYRYSVHDYTNRGSEFSTELAASGATVSVYRSTGLVRTFTVPPGQLGTLWTVFELDGTTITPLNIMSNEYDPGAVLAPPSSSVVKGDVSPSKE